MPHPNATAASLASGASVLLIWLLHSIVHVDLSIYYASLITGGLTSVVLFVGRRGLKATLTGLWGGSASIWNGAAPPAPTK